MTNLKSDTIKPLMIIPAAGWGRSVGSPISKEMLPGPDGKPLIAHSLNLAQEYGFDVLVIARKEKTNLLEYLSTKQVQILLIEPTKEWPETILKSSDYWQTKNIVCLPDTTFGPPQVLQQITNYLDHADFVFATFKTKDQSGWGLVFNIDQSHFEIAEKPKIQKENALAWGLFGFKKENAYKGLEHILESSIDHEWKNINLKNKIVMLDYFKDYTRNT